MIRYLLLAAVFICGKVTAQTSPEITADDLRRHIYILASDSLEGRRSGEIGAEKAARYIAGEFRRIGLIALDSTNSYLQHFSFSERALDTTKTERTYTANVAGLLLSPRKDAVHEVIVVGAHYDHLGSGGRNALDTVKGIHYGADDNASGTSGVIELAEYLASRQDELQRSILFITFSGEELGLHGSMYYTNNPLVPLERTAAMINMDMIGRLKDSTLIVEGFATSPYWKELFTKVDTQYFHIRYKPGGIGPSDHTSFYRKQIPNLFFFTGLHKDYHKTTDTKEKINYEGTRDVLKLIGDCLLYMAAMPEPIPFTEVPVDTTKKVSGFSVYVGGTPDYGYEGDGLKIADVTAGSPAEQAGMKPEDIIIKFDTVTIKNIYDYTSALGNHKPGDIVDVVVKRGSSEVTLKVLLATRNKAH